MQQATSEMEAIIQKGGSLQQWVGRHPSTHGSWPWICWNSWASPPWNWTAQQAPSQKASTGAP